MRSCAATRTCSSRRRSSSRGIDIPQANTLIVERADTLGLSQLYQIRGRVGRSRRHRARVPSSTRTCQSSGPRHVHGSPRSPTARSLARASDRDARPRNSRCGEPARRRAVRSCRRARVRAVRRAARRGRCRLSGQRAAPPGRVVELAVDGDVLVVAGPPRPAWARDRRGAAARGGTGYHNEGQGPRACDVHGIPRFGRKRGNITGYLRPEYRVGFGVHSRTSG